MRRLLRETGFDLEREVPIPAPIPLVVKNPFWQRTLMRAQSLLMRVSRGLFAYQMLLVVKARPTLPTLLHAARRHSDRKSADLAVGV
jgi:hypothetical protein